MRKQPYNQEIRDFIKDNLGKISLIEIADSLKLEVSSVRGIIASQHLNDFTEADKQYLKDNFRTTKNVVLAKHLGRSARSIESFMRKHGMYRTFDERVLLAKNVNYTPEIITFIRNNYGKLTQKQLADHLKFSVKSIGRFIEKNGVQKINPKVRTSIFTKKHRAEDRKKQEDFLKNYKHKSLEEASQELVNEGRVPIRLDEKTVIWPLKSQCIQSENGSWKKIDNKK